MATTTSALPTTTNALPDSEKHLSIKTHTEQRHPNNAPSQKTAMPRWGRRGKGSSTIARACSWAVDHQISISATLLSQLLIVHNLFPNARHHTQKFFRISYYNPMSGRFLLGWDDIFFVFYWIIVFTGMRCATMDYILSPLAQWFGVKKRKARVRFAEQAWILIYYTLFWITGMRIMYNSDYWLDLRALWKNWPDREMSGMAKWYYLVQFAFWLQQIVVVNIEARRKDHWQMFTHHIITCALVFTSYGYHQTKVGTLILCLMDIADVFLSLAKILKYLHFQTVCDVTFGIFLVTWFIPRHVCYMWVCWSIYKHIPEEIQYGCYKGSGLTLQGPLPVPNDWNHLTQPFRDPVGLVCWNDNIKWTFLGMLLALQCVLLGWFIMIVKVAYKVITGKGAEEPRSDDEDSEEETEDADCKPIIPVEKISDIAEIQSRPYIEKEASTDDDHFFRSKSPGLGRRRDVGNSSGVNILAQGSSDRKELLGRIGCDKGAD